MSAPEENDNLTRDTGQITEKDIGKALMGVLHALDAEYDSMSQEDLLNRWHFRFDSGKPISWNMYRFHDTLTLYASSCRRWEEKNNGRTSVVERVRDKYLLPRIKEFEAELRAHFAKTQK